jgi:hypothetical protein
MKPHPTVQIDLFAHPPVYCCFVNICSPSTLPPADSSEFPTQRTAAHRPGTQAVQHNLCRGPARARRYAYRSCSTIRVSSVFGDTRIVRVRRYAYRPCLAGRGCSALIGWGSRHVRPNRSAGLRASGVVRVVQLVDYGVMHMGCWSSTPPFIVRGVQKRWAIGSPALSARRSADLLRRPAGSDGCSVLCTIVSLSHAWRAVRRTRLMRPYRNRAIRRDHALCWRGGVRAGFS